MRRSGRVRQSGLVALLAAITAMIALAWWGTASTTSHRQAAPPVGPTVPAPDTTAMQPPVARLIREAREAVLDAPTSAAAWGHYGCVLDAHQLYDVASTCYGRAHELDPTEFKWVYFQAIVLHHVGAPADTTAPLFREAMRLNPRYPPVHARLGDVLFEGGRYEEALKAFDAALTMAPGYAVAHRGVGHVRLALGDPTGAAEYLQRAIHLEDGDRAAYVALARAYRQLGRPDHARAAARHASTLGTRYHYRDAIRGEQVGNLGASSMVVIDRARFMLANGQHERALQDLKLAEQMLPDDQWVQRQLANVYDATGRPELARVHRVRADQLRDDR